MQDQPVVRVAAKRLRDAFLELRFDLVDRLSRRKTGTVLHAEDMRVHRECFLSERSVEDDVGRLPANPRERL